MPLFGLKYKLFLEACGPIVMFVIPSLNEIFTTPDCRTANGVVFNSRPLVFHNNIIDNFYIELINLVRSHNPRAYIICVYGMMVRNMYVEAGIINAVNESNDVNLFALELPINNDGVQYHPNLVGARNQANVLTAFMNSINSNN